MKKLILFTLAFVLLGPNTFGKINIPFSKKSPKTVVILSIDGGGVRGIVPALILRAIEKKLPYGTHLTDYFHIMSGTSTGALICLMLNKPVDGDRERYKMLDIIRLYKTLSEEVFKISLWQTITSIGGFKSAKYNSKPLETYLSNYLGYSKLSETYVSLLIPAFDLKTRKMQFFRTHKARSDSRKDYFLKDVARATTSAPTYFEAAYIKNILNIDEGIYIDGGVGVNNPTVASIVHAFEIYGNNIEIFVLSLGTGTSYFSDDDNVSKLKLDIHDMGKIDWASYIIDVLMDANTDVTHFYALIGLNPKYYHRIQINIDEKNMSLDDGSHKHLERLTKLTNDFIQENDGMLNEIANSLIRFKKKNS